MKTNYKLQLEIQAYIGNKQSVALLREFGIAPMPNSGDWPKQSRPELDSISEERFDAWIKWYQWVEAEGVLNAELDAQNRADQGYSNVGLVRRR